MGMKTLRNPKVAGGVLLLMGLHQFNYGTTEYAGPPTNRFGSEFDLLPDAIPLVGRFNPTPLQLLGVVGIASGIALLME
tara:strand:+ start:225 stop:461 length:237 start_codon:yes stop_codon:yes gene_type:complete